MAYATDNGILANWKCLLACFIIAMGPFQYGVDFGLVAGLQAMIGFNRVRLQPIIIFEIVSI